MRTIQPELLDAALVDLSTELALAVGDVTRDIDALRGRVLPALDKAHAAATTRRQRRDVSRVITLAHRALSRYYAQLAWLHSKMDSLMLIVDPPDEDPDAA